MQRYTQRIAKWMMLIGTGSVMFQAASCDLAAQWLQTGFLGGIAGLLYYLARNV